MVNKNINNKISVSISPSTYPDFPYLDSPLLGDLLNLLESLGLDRNNPFSSYIKPGQTAVIKPNWVRDINPLGFNTDSLITHTSIIKYVIDFLAIAMEGRGKIIIGDAPLQNCNFQNLQKISNTQNVLKDFKQKYPDLDISVEDWRLTIIENSNSDDKEVQKNPKINGEEFSNYKIIDVGNKSFLEEVSKKAHNFRVTKYKPSLMKNHHSEGKHEYLIANRVFEADFFINIPKMKTHIKAGLTGALKNLVGINGHKEFLPHHIKGSPKEGGDNYRSSSWMKRRYEDLYDYVWENINNFSVPKRKFLIRSLHLLLKLSDLLGGDFINAGSWKGNDTIWRTTLDLNHIVYFYSEKPTKVLNIIDGVIAGEGEGPLEPTPKFAGVLLAGENPALLDATISRLLGYSIEEVKTAHNALKNTKSGFFVKDLSEIQINLLSNGQSPINLYDLTSLCFKRPKHW